MNGKPVTKFSGPRLNDRMIHELIGMARGMVADGVLNDAEIEALLKWLAAHESITENPVVMLLLERIEGALEDGLIDEEERAEIFMTLNEFCRNDFEVGEVLKATTLPLCDPPPAVEFPGNRFTFTGTFTFGSRRSCEEAVKKLGGEAGSLTRRTRYLVIGEYATDSWAHSTFGRKIEKAVQWRDEEDWPISIISEKHWRAHLPPDI